MVRRWLVRMRPARLQVICSTATVAEALPSYEPRCWAALPDGTAATGATSVQVPSCNGTRKLSCRLQDCRDDCFPEGTVNGNVDALTTHWLIGNVSGLPSPIEPIEGGRPETPALGERPGPEVHSVGDGHGQGVGGQVPREAKPHRRRVSVRPPARAPRAHGRGGVRDAGWLRHYGGKRRSQPGSTVPNLNATRSLPEQKSPPQELPDPAGPASCGRNGRPVGVCG